MEIEMFLKGNDEWMYSMIIWDVSGKDVDMKIKTMWSQQVWDILIFTEQKN